MQTLESALAELPFFHGLEPAYLAALAQGGAQVRFKPGDFIFRQGEDSSHFYVLSHGMVALELAAPGRGPVVVQTLHAGELLGWSWYVAPYKRHFDARVLEVTRAIALDAAAVRQHCDADPKLGCEVLKRLIQVVGQRLCATRFQLLDLYGRYP